MSTIPLAKGFSKKHLRFPVLLSRKFDGVPIRIDIDCDGNHTVRTRQGKDVPAVRNLVQEFTDRYINGCTEAGFAITLVGEVVQHENLDADFKETSGLVRKHEDQSHKLAIMLFECDLNMKFIDRAAWMQDFLQYIHGRVHVVPQWYGTNMEQIEAHHQAFMAAFPKAEGMVIRNHDDPWAPGRRSWGYQKWLFEPTIDLRIVGVEEAIDKYGNPKGMAGGLIASYKGNLIGIGPGRLTHAERIELWEVWHNTRLTRNWPNSDSAALRRPGPTRIAQIKHKGDGSYDALRQPTFQHWRDDKEIPDA